MAQLPFIAAIDAGIHQEMRRDPSVLYFGQNMATTENHEFVAAYGHDRVRVTPISETAEIGIAIGAAMAGLRPGGRALHGGVHARRHGSSRQRSAPLPLHVGRTGESAAGAQGGLRLRLRLGGSAHRVIDCAVHGSSGSQGRGPLDRGGRQGTDGHGHPRRQSRWSSCITICSRSNRARCRTASTWCRSARPRFAAPAAMSPSSRPAGWCRARWLRPRSSPRKGSRPK